MRRRNSTASPKAFLRLEAGGAWNFKKAQDVGLLVDSWEVKDPNTWIFRLKKGLKRHNGGPELTAADVVHSINRLKTDPRSAQKQNVKKIKSVEAIGT